MLNNIKTLQTNKKKGVFEIVVTAGTILEMMAIIDKIIPLTAFTNTMEIACLELLKENLDMAYMETFNRLAQKNPETEQFSIPNNTPVELPLSILDSVGWLGERVVTAEVRDNRIEL
jgi:hypothetical protein